MNLDQLINLAQARFEQELKQGLSITKACAQVIYDQYDLRNVYLDQTKSIEDCLKITSQAVLTFIDFIFSGQHKLDGAIFGTDEVFNPLLEHILSSNESRRNTNIDSYYKELHKAMFYSLSSTGKMLRPFIILLIASFHEKIDGGEAIITATSLECIHTYSLIHDDLPAMDNDDYRRGKLTNHMVFGENHAILAGDALQTLAFSLLTENEDSGQKLIAAYHKVRHLALGAGMNGMCLGQSFDLLSESLFEEKINFAQNLKQSETDCVINGQTNEQISRHLIKNINLSKSQASGILTELHYRKTAFLIRTSVMLGLCCTYDSLFNQLIIKTYGDRLFQQWAFALGLAFQIKDDLLDVEGDIAEIGKPVGSDDQNHKLTYVSLLGLEQTRQDLMSQMQLANHCLDMITQYIQSSYTDSALESVNSEFGSQISPNLIKQNLVLVDRLTQLTDFVVNRKK